MTNTTFVTDFLAEQAKNVLGATAYEDFITYDSTPENQRSTLDRGVRKHYNRYMEVIEKMASYGNNHWWMVYNSQDDLKEALLENTESETKVRSKLDDIVKLRKKIRVYYQIFHCGMDVLLVTQGQLLNDINDILTHKGIVVTSWALNYGPAFERYKKIIKEILNNDEDFQAWLKEIDSG